MGNSITRNYIKLYSGKREQDTQEAIFHSTTELIRETHGDTTRASAKVGVIVGKNEQIILANLRANEAVMLMYYG